MRLSSSSPLLSMRPEARAVVLAAAAIATTGLMLLSSMAPAAADVLSQQQKTGATVLDRVSFCVEKAVQPSETIALAKFQASHSSRFQANLVRTSGWATLPGAVSPDNRLAANCSTELRKLAAEWRFRGSIQSAAFSQGGSVIHKMWTHDAAR